MASAVHRCLAIPEIVEQIIEACGWNAGPSRFPWYSTLASVARTCTVLCEPALNILWRAQYCLDNLVKTLPSRLWSEVDGNLILEAQGDFNDWERFDYYASRIIELYVDTVVPACLQTFIPILMHRRGVNSLFPNLSLLNLSDRSMCGSPNVPSISLFFGPKLRTLDVVAVDTSQAPSFPSDLTYLPRLSPDLRNLTIVFKDHNVLGKLSSILPGLDQLRSLCFRLDNFNDGDSILFSDNLEIISTLPHLENFSTNCLHTPSRITSTAHAPGSSFRALKCLSFSDCRTVRGCIQFMESYRPTSVEDLHLSFMDGSSTEEFSGTAFIRLMQAIRDVLQHSRLKRFLIRVMQCSQPEITISSLRPLFTFHELQWLEINAILGVRLDDDALEELAQAFAHLRHLRICGIFPHRRLDVPTPTLLALVHLVQYCPHLESLDMEFDASQVSLEDMRPGRGYHNAHIKSLHVVRSPWTSEAPIANAELAAFLLDLFPNLSSIRTWGWAEDDPEWGEVERFLPVLRRVRQWGRESTAAELPAA